MTRRSFRLWVLSRYVYGRCWRREKFKDTDRIQGTTAILKCVVQQSDKADEDGEQRGAIPEDYFRLQYPYRFLSVPIFGKVQ